LPFGGSPTLGVVDLPCQFGTVRPRANMMSNLAIGPFVAAIVFVGIVGSPYAQSPPLPVSSPMRGPTATQSTAPRPVVPSPPPHTSMPARPEQILCIASSLIVGKVIDSSIVSTDSSDCRLENLRFCHSSAVVGLKIRVNEIVGESNVDIRVRDIISAEGTAQNSAPLIVNGRSLNFNSDDTGFIVLQPTGKPATNEEVRSALVAKQFMFALHTPGDGHTYWTTTWPMRMSDWARKIWLNGTCSRWKSFR